MGTTAIVLYVFKSELVDFEGTFGGYLYNYSSFVRHVQMVASACQRSHPASLEVTESMLLWLDHALTVKIQKNDNLLGYYTHQTNKQLYRYPPKVPSKSTNSDLKTYKTVAVRSHFKMRSHFFGNPVSAMAIDGKLYICYYMWTMTPARKEGGIPWCERGQKKYMFRVQLTTGRIGDHTRLIHVWMDGWSHIWQEEYGSTR